jgi:hypothetical protein
LSPYINYSNGSNCCKAIKLHKKTPYHAGRASRLDSVERIDLIEEQVVPLFYARNAAGEPEAWVKKSKASMKTILPRYNGIRMCVDYLRELYAPAIRHCDTLARAGGTSASELAAWKKRVAAAWNGVHLQLAREPSTTIHAGEPLLVEVAVQLNGLDASDVVVECLVGEVKDVDGFVPLSAITLDPTGQAVEGESIFATDLRGCSNLPWKASDKFASASTPSIHCSRTVSNAASWRGSSRAAGPLEPVQRLSAGNHTITAA